MRSIAIILLLCPLCTFSQYDPQKVLAFAKAHEGTRVGNGVCVTLVVEALKESGFTPMYRPWVKDIWWGKRVRPSKVQKGDIMTIWFDLGYGHIGIITDVLGDNQFVYADQNHGNRRLRDSKVGYHTFHLSEKDGKIKFYRPEYTWQMSVVDRLFRQRQLPGNEERAFNR